MLSSGTSLAFFPSLSFSLSLSALLSSATISFSGSPFFSGYKDDLQQFQASDQPTNPKRWKENTFFQQFQQKAHD